MFYENPKIDEILSGIQKIIEMLSSLEAVSLSSASSSQPDDESRYTYGKGYAEVLDEGSYYRPYSSVVNLHSDEYISEAAMAKYMKKLLSERNYGS